MLDIKHKDTSTERNGRWRILQEPRSLLITTGELYTGCLHGISEIDKDGELGGEPIANWGLLGDREAFGEGWKMRGTRVSLTFRDVVKVKSLGKAFGGLRR